jgi:hypothetical protein
MHLVQPQSLLFVQEEKATTKFLHSQQEGNGLSTEPTDLFYKAKSESSTVQSFYKRVVETDWFCCGMMPLDPSGSIVLSLRVT